MEPIRQLYVSDSAAWWPSSFQGVSPVRPRNEDLLNAPVDAERSSTHRLRPFLPPPFARTENSRSWHLLIGRESWQQAYTWQWNRLIYEDRTKLIPFQGNPPFYLGNRILDGKINRNLISQNFTVQKRLKILTVLMWRCHSIPFKRLRILQVRQSGHTGNLTWAEFSGHERQALKFRGAYHKGRGIQ
jgi:hypothetical protein